MPITEEFGPSDTAFVGRFAPTPSGRMHLGNLLSFMVAWIAARQAGGRMRMRIEDLDTARTTQKFADQIMRDLEWLGLTWDGPALYQSRRSEAYEAALERLDAQGLLYPCFCSRADLHAATAPHFGDEYVYRGTCRGLSDAERAARSQSRPAALRVAVGQAAYRFEDALQGAQSFDLSECSGDFIVRRSDGVFAYQLAVVVDDAEQGITSVVRGVDLMTSTPRQLYLQDKLGLPHPTYAHVPVLLDSAGNRLAKRAGDASLSSLIDGAKWSAPMILGALAYECGLIENAEPITAEELVGVSDLSALKGVQTLVWQNP